MCSIVGLKGWLSNMGCHSGAVTTLVCIRFLSYRLHILSTVACFLNLSMVKGRFLELQLMYVVG